jgi:hypothetical protein
VSVPRVKEQSICLQVDDVHDHRAEDPKNGAKDACEEELFGKRLDSVEFFVEREDLKRGSRRVGDKVVAVDIAGRFVGLQIATDEGKKGRRQNGRELTGKEFVRAWRGRT